MTVSVNDVSDMMELLAPIRGLELTAVPNTKSDHLVWKARNKETGTEAHVVISGVELLANAADPDALRGLVGEKLRSVERTLKHEHEMRLRDVHELQLVAMGWRPPPTWKHPFEKTQRAGQPGESGEQSTKDNAAHVRKGGDT